MKEFKNNEELLSLVKEKNSIQYIDFEFQDIYCAFDIILPDVSLINAGDIRARGINAADIKAEDIKAWSINAGDIKAFDIKASSINAADIKAEDIKAWSINAGDIKAEDIKAWSINAGDIKAFDINAADIKAEHISYYAVCFAYKNIVCKSIKGRYAKSKHFVFDGKLIIDGVEQ